MIINQQTKLYGVMGHPIGHSLSPILHNAAFRVCGINAVYLAFESRDAEGCLSAMRALGIRGMSVTIPHKSKVIPLLDELDPLAKSVGAVNTIVNHSGRLVGHNTDAIGALRAIEEKVPLSVMRCLLIGAGGAAHAIGFVLKDKGVALSVVNRSRDRGEALAGKLHCPYIPLEEVVKQDADMVIQTTPVGIYPHVNQCPVPEQLLKKDMLVMDIIYNPLETQLLKKAKDHGCTIIDGLSMFVYQGAEQFELWTGVHPPVSEMRSAVEGALRKQNERN
jgi:shikimate dehydrogenase